MLDGKVVRLCTSEQRDHFGQIQTGSDETDGTCYVYGIANLIDKHEVLQKGDSIRFQLATVRSTGKRIATNIASSRRFLRTRVDSMKGQVLGTLDFSSSVLTCLALLCPATQGGSIKR